MSMTVLIVGLDNMDIVVGDHLRSLLLAKEGIEGGIKGVGFKAG